MELDVKKAVSIIVFCGICIIFPLSLARAGNYHIKGQNLNCYDCHTLHFSQDGATPQVPDGARPWGEGPQDYLLKNTTSEMCLMCHDGYNLEAPNVMYSTSRDYQSSAGYLGEEKNADSGVFGHTLNSPNPPPGYQGTWNRTLSCTSCHDPHGNSYYRNLRPKPLADSANSPVTYFIGTSVSGNEDKGIQIAVDSADASSSPYDLTKIIYRQEGEAGEDTVGLSFWCAGCHPAFNQRGDVQGTRTLHPTYGITMSQAKPSISQWWSATASGPPTRPPTVTSSSDTDRGSDRPFCGSCHKAHGSTHRYGLLWENPASPDREGGQYMRDTCQACHHIGNGHYESSPHADPNFGVYRVPEFGRGECEQCHRQHGTANNPQGNAHNLFAESNKSFCLTPGCHWEVPASYPLSEEKLPQGAKARISLTVDAGNDRAFLGYFELNSEINNTAVRLGGLQYRGRWPGALAYNNEQYSPHGRENGAMPNEGSCMNCHSPHGTESRFDMLQLPYEGTSGSGIAGADNYELCLSCHSENGPSGMRPETKRIADYYSQDDLYSGHKIKSDGGFARPGDKLACSNCHNPHGSMGNNQSGPNLHLLSDERPGWRELDTLNDPNSSRRFCFGCHVPSNKPEVKSVVEGITMKPIPDFAEHRDGEGSTESCHSCHGSSYDAPDSENVHHLSPGSCDKCHADQGAWQAKKYSGPHAYHTDKYAFACEVCHARMNHTAGKAIHGNGKAPGSNCQYAQVCFHDGSDSIEWKNQILHQKTYRYRSLYHNPYLDNAGITPGYDASTYDLPDTCKEDPIDPNRVFWTDQSTFSGHNSCSTVWCHSNANPLSLPNHPRENSYQANPSFALTWDDHNANRCNNCHGFIDLDQPADTWQLSSYHRKHIVVTTPNKDTTGMAKILCTKCHAGTCTDNENTIREDIGYANHVNGKKDIIFADPNGKYAADRTCSVNCHSRDGRLLSVSWEEQNPESVCGTCHDVFGPGRTISKDGHAVHLISDRGPGPHSPEQCNDCHTSHDDPAHCNGVPDFKDGQTLAQTSVCDKCHSPGGDYDGVNDPSIGAKANWKSGGVYVQAPDGKLELRGGREKWCVGCHDKEPAASRSDGSGVSAPNVAGDETALTQYGRGYGYFVTGHGLEEGKSYPGSEERGAGASCTDCHDARLGHIDHAHRTYSASRNNYQAGYRLKASALANDPARPMDIPRTASTGPNNNPQQYWQDFALCFQCHDRFALLGNGVSSDQRYLKDPLQTNFYNSSYLYENSDKSVNLHLSHLSGRGGGGNNPDWTSSWNSTGDSAMSCPACHNVHGSPTPRMMRHGELISTPGTSDKVPGLNFRYQPSGSTLPGSTGGEIFSQFSAGRGTISQNRICETCHPAYVKYTRTPYINPDNINPQIESVVAWNGPTGGRGIDDGDQLVITFTTATNGPQVIKLPEDVKFGIKIYGDSNCTLEKAWSTPANIEWSSAGGRSNDTLRLILRKEGTDIAIGDYLRVLPGNLEGIVGGISRQIDSSREMTGTFDCALVRVCAENQSQSEEPGIQEGDQVTVYFSGSIDVGSGGTSLTAANIDQALRLSSGHTWGQVKEIRWNAPANDTLTIILGNEQPAATIAVGDSITLGDIIRDQSANILSGSAILEGSFDSYPLLSPLAVYSSNIPGPPWGNTMKSIDGDPNTLWFLGPSAEGKISYDLGTMYRVSRVWISSGGSGGNASAKVWVTAGPEYDETAPTLDSWQIPVTQGWHSSPQFDAVGRYLRIEARKIGNGPLGELFHEVAFQGTTALPHVNPRILGVEARNNASGGAGVDDGDQVVITFNVSTNGPEVIRGPADVESVLSVYGDANHKVETRKSWGTPGSIEWSAAGGQANDTLTIILKKEGATLAAGDHVEVSSLKLKARAGGFELPIISSRVITGTFDCSLARAVAGNQSQSPEPGIQEGDQVIISFAGKTFGNAITAETINTALQVNNGHSWGQVKAIEWNAPANDTLKITFGSGAPVPTIAVGDTITLGDIICDQSQHPIIGSVTLTGSFDPPVATWRTPEAIHSFSPTWGGNTNAARSIDSDPNTMWTVLDGTARITYDLKTQHQVSSIRFFSTSGGVKVSVKTWVTDEPVYDPNNPTTGPFEISGVSGWAASPYQFYSKGRYLTLEVKKLTPGPLSSYIAEVQYQDGEIPLPDISPQILKAEALNSISGGTGVDDGDQMVITFNVSTNGPEVIRGPADVESVLSVYGDANHKVETRKSWGTPGSIEWSAAGGQANDTLTIILKKEGATLAAGDHVEVSSLKLKARAGGFELPIISSRVITGTFDCSLARAVAGNQSQSPEPGIQEGDQVIISFAGKTFGNAITAETINTALQVNNGHSWGQVKAIEWNAPANDTLKITFGSGAPVPTIAVGDTITLGDIICDQSQHPIIGSVTLTGSFDPPVATWRTPEAIHSFSPTWGGNTNAARSIDSDPNTPWSVLDGTARITYDLEPEYQTQYQVSRIRLFSRDSRGKASVKVWVTPDPVYDPEAPTYGPYEISQVAGWAISPEFDARGRYLTLDVRKLLPGPLGNWIGEIQFFGMAPPASP
ncbi:MAG: cytochrome c3 family protein [bacterium]